MQNIMNSKLQNITILGATGSIGTSTLNVLRLHLDKYKIYAVSGKSQITKLFDICKEFNPIFAVVLDITSQEKLQNLIILFVHNFHYIAYIHISFPQFVLNKYMHNILNQIHLILHILKFH